MKFHRNAIVIYEDRHNYEIGVQSLVLSLEGWQVSADIHVFCPSPTPALKNWLQTKTKVTWHQTIPSQSRGWNVKPDLLYWAIKAGYQQVIWLDSDIICASNIDNLIIKQPLNVLVLSELPFNRYTLSSRTEAWGLTPGTIIWTHNPPSSCCSRFTVEHVQFIEQWRNLLSSEQYLYYQSIPNRPPEFYGDDSALQALLGCKYQGDDEIFLLKSGVHIAQCLTPGSFNYIDRLQSLWRKMPPLIHAMGPKPWHHQNHNSQALSPYSLLFFLSHYHDEIDLNEENLHWVNTIRKCLARRNKDDTNLNKNDVFLLGINEAFKVNINNIKLSVKKQLQKTKNSEI